MTDGTTNLTTEQLHLVKQGAERVKGDFAGVFSVETIERFMTESRERRGPGDGDDLAADPDRTTRPGPFPGPGKGGGSGD